MNDVLLIDCPDEKGLVHRVTGVLFEHGHNIVSNAEFVDRQTARFFMRTEVEGVLAADVVVAGLRSSLPPAATIRVASGGPKDIVVLTTREPHCLGDLLIRHAYGELNAKILAVVSNRPSLGSLVAKFDIPFHHVGSEGLDRPQHERLVLETVAAYSPEYLVLAKYMRILSPEFVSRFPSRIVNIHHSFLPAFVGANPYRQAFERGVKIIGATAHFVDDELDRGPIIAQAVLPVDHTHAPADMAEAGKDVEKIVLAKALKLVFEDRVFVNGNRTVIFD